jgi:hypothetical protein
MQIAVKTSMSSGKQKPQFETRPHPESGWIINAIWPDGEVEQLLGVFRSQTDAERWIRTHAAAFIEQRSRDRS